MTRNKASGFTLVELLVVIAVISTLAALLLPVLEGALYSAKFVACKNNLRQIGMGLLIYADESNDYYPYRALGNIGHAPGRITWLRHNIWGDDTGALIRYDILELFTCPLAAGPTGSSMLDPALGRVYGSYNVWFGNEYLLGKPERAMLRVGDRPAWAGKTYSILVADMDMGTLTSGFSAHQNREASLSPWFEEPLTDWWRCGYKTSGYPFRGTVDRNFLHDDGSVQGLAGLIPEDPRLTRFRTLSGNEYFAFLPWD